MTSRSNDSSSGDVDLNPIVEALTAAKVTKPYIVFGYQGAAPDPKSLRIYSALEDLSEWHDVAKDDLVHYVTPVNPLHPSTFFLKPDASVVNTQRLDAKAGKFLHGSLQARYAARFAATDEDAPGGGTMGFPVTPRCTKP